jgi:uncharacterized protein (DUF2141 family)
MKKILAGLTIALTAGISFAQTSLNLEIAGVIKEGGKLYVSLFNSEQSFKEKKTYYSFIANPGSETVAVQLSLPAGEYFFSIYQDSNNNGKLDTNIVGIPKELFGFSNYDGKTVPGDYKRHKVIVNNLTDKIKVQLYKI